ncbi:hypothetical protein HZA43_01655 [Candidatus Peregrinibacteria bacterium]|nr:hypothetical protein [Candidatus Peregrinibacteria bacterium]
MPSKPPEGSADHPVFSGSVLRRRPGERVAAAVLEPEDGASEPVTASLRRSKTGHAIAGAAALSMACGGHTDVPPSRGGPAVIRRGGDMSDRIIPPASADEIHPVAEDVRTIVNLILRRPEGWNQMVYAIDALAPKKLLVDTRDSAALVGAEAVHETRDAVILVLRLPRGQEMRINIGCGVTQEGPGTLWKLRLPPESTTGVMRTFGAGNPILPSSIMTTLRGGGETTNLNDHPAVPLTPHWVDGAVRPVATAEWTNSGKPGRFSVNSAGLTPSIVVDGKLRDGSDFALGSDARVGVVAYSPDGQLDEPPFTATIEVKPILKTGD